LPETVARSGREEVRVATLAQNDIVSLHCPLVPDTYHPIDERSRAKMKRGAMMINTGCGGPVESNALTSALKSGQLGNLGLDVYEEEGGLFSSRTIRTCRYRTMCWRDC
jgi:D-lactate dehydrogenase